MSALVIQALKSIGEANVTPKTIQLLRSRLSAEDKSAIIKEAAESTDWVYDTIRQIVGEVQA